MKRVAIRIVSKLSELSYYAKRFFLIGLDAILIAIALWGAVALRLEEFWPSMWSQFFWIFYALPIVSFPVFISSGLYHAVIRYASLDALWVVFKAVYSSFFLLWALVLVHGTVGFPRSVPFIYFFLSFLFIGGSRLTYRYLYYRFINKNEEAKKVIIYGAGSSGAQICSAFKHSNEFLPIAFVDDKKALVGRDLHGIRIYSTATLSELVDRLKPNLILLAMPSVTRKKISEILSRLESLPVEVKTLPHIDQLVSKDVSLEQIRNVAIEDLLGRDPVPPKMGLIESCITGKAVMVTGAGGSIGSELCRQILSHNPKRLVLFERSEFALYTIENELAEKFRGKIEIVPVLGSVCRKRRITAVIKALEIDTIYHAAAYKHVPLVEFNPIEGIRNNLFGTLITAQAAQEGGVETFVLISTDKAVRPTNVMGASKRMAELVLQGVARENSKTRFTMVRFGNVLGSSGSVVPLFRKQIENGGPVTVTHADITRFFMTIPEAVQLVLQAGAMGEGGDVFVLNMGESVKIKDLAERMIHLCGRSVQSENNPDGEIAIEYTGLRPGEKLYEELLVDNNVIGTEHPMIMRAEERFLPWVKLEKVLDELNRACRNFDYEYIREVLKVNVDGYAPQCDWVDPVWLASHRDDAFRNGLRVEKKPVKDNIYQIGKK